MGQNDNLEKGRLPKFEGDLTKVKTTLTLSESSRKFLSNRGNKMSETIEALVWLASNGKSGYLSQRFELWKDVPPGKFKQARND